MEQITNKWTYKLLLNIVENLPQEDYEREYKIIDKQRKVSNFLYNVLVDRGETNILDEDIAHNLYWDGRE